MPLSPLRCSRSVVSSSTGALRRLARYLIYCIRHCWTKRVLRQQLQTTSKNLRAVAKSKLTFCWICLIDFPPDTEILLFRVLQESLTNIHRHSDSDRAKIRAGFEGETVYLEIRDYGHGIPQKVLERKLDISSSTDGTILRFSLLARETSG